MTNNISNLIHLALQDLEIKSDKNKVSLQNWLTDAFLLGFSDGLKVQKVNTANTNKIIFEEGMKVGYEESQQEAHQEGYEKGFQQGFQQGLMVNSDQSFIRGFDAGYEQGCITRSFFK